MRARRALFGSLAVVLAMSSAACGRDTTQQQVDEKDETSSAAQSPEMRKEPFPKKPNAEAVWQTASVDVEATSRHRTPKGGPDSATVTISTLLTRDPSSEFREFIENLEDVDGSFDKDNPRLMRMIYRMEVEEVTDEDVPEDTDRYRVTLGLPLDFITITKEGDVSLTVLLPRPAQDYQVEEEEPDVPEYRVEFVRTEGEPAGELVSVEGEEPSQREGVFFYANIDDIWSTVYELIDDVVGG